MWRILSISGIIRLIILTPEYCKSMETFVKKIVNVQSSLACVFKQVSTAAKVGNKESEKMSYLPIRTCMPLEEHARTVLTHFAFSAFQHEIVQSMQYAITEMSDGSYLVRHYKKMERECLVILIPADEQVHCSCKGFEHSGILYRHSLRVLVVKNYFQVPVKYFMLRWRLESSLIPLEDDRIVTNSNDECSRDFHSLAANLFSESFLSREQFDFVRGKLEQLLEDVWNMPV